MRPDQRAGRLGVGTIGAGRVGAVLASALGGAGHALTGIAAVSEESRERAAAMLPGVPVLALPEIVERSELVLLAVPGDELGPLVEGLATAGAWRPGQLVVHTAAGHGVGVLEPAMRAGAIPLAVHPAMSFTGTSVDLGRLAGTWFAVTAPAPVLPIAQALVVEMGGEPFVVAEADRPAYAEAIDTAVSFSTAIVDQATGILEGIGMPRAGAVLAPLVRSAVENALARHDPGPMIDGAATIDGADDDRPSGGGA
ncbi:hypothetical protein GCM10017608_14020 [Agromyces luteolus]|uniref:DUF2520 domain-containing protein n=1 Tax=Agromyces luteolus TaxID=88373 RepID=A0A7C9HIC6_9MICO|nr:Rossmann-like and DUF2520 domain-containing protein [Agromyces luteolus]MUN07701.1 DUF2520 domain-containing protein [Agromyces luteolus]GLK27468.1 hypothetical protein GCM10017608_14020 [Agromyces luteolus]